MIDNTDDGLNGQVGQRYVMISATATTTAYGNSSSSNNNSSNCNASIHCKKISARVKFELNSNAVRAVCGPPAPVPAWLHSAPAFNANATLGCAHACNGSSSNRGSSREVATC